MTLSSSSLKAAFAKANKLIKAQQAVSAPSTEYDDKVFTKTQQAAQFPGGAEAWIRYLQRNLEANAPALDRAPAGQYPVTVQFIVDKEGNVSNVSAISVPRECPSCGSAAVKVIRGGPKWQPAVQNGRNVTYQAVQKITFFASGP